MSRYQRLFDVTVQHQYYSVRTARPVRFMPSPICAAYLEQADLLVRYEKFGFAVYYDIETADRLRAYIAEFRAGLELCFVVQPLDPLWALVTAPSVSKPTNLFFLDSRRAHVDQDGVQQLSKSATVSAADEKTMQCKLVADNLQATDQIVKPAALINIVLSADRSGLCWPELVKPDDPRRSFCVSFGPNQSYWKYYFVGDLAAREIFISDVKKKITFTDLGVVNLPGSRTAKVFMSDVMLPMQDRHEQSLQLRENGELSQKVLIKRMPNPGAGQFFRELVDNKVALVSEVYINQ